jgi:uncharacterized membrane protein
METVSERRMESLERRLERIEHALGAAGISVEPPPPPPEAESPPAAAPVVVSSKSPRRELTWEDVVGGRVFAWLGGVAVVLGVAFFVGMAINRGWIGVPARMALAGAGSTALLLAGLWLHERRGRTQAARAAVAAALAAEYATLTATVLLYHLLSYRAGLVAAGLVGAIAIGTAVRWRSQVVGGIGLVGALLAPVLVGARTSTVSLAFVAVALVAVTAVLLRERWAWLALCSFVVTAPQLPAWIDAERNTHLLATLLVLSGFSALFLAAALGHSFRADERVPFAAMAVAFLDIAMTAGTGWDVLHSAGHHDAANAWLVVSAAIHVALGLAVIRPAREVGFVIGALGLAQSAVGFALVLHGPAIVVVWSAHAVALAWLARVRAEPAALVSAGLFLVGGLVHALAVDAPPSVLVHPVDDLANACAAVGVVAVAAAACAWLLRERAHAEVLGWAAGFACVYLASVFVVARAGGGQPGQIALSVLWSITGVALLVAGLARDARRLRTGGLILLCLAVTKVFAYDLATLASGYRVVSFLALGMLLLMGAFAYQRKRVPE